MSKAIKAYGQKERTFPKCSYSFIKKGRSNERPFFLGTFKK